MGTDPKAGKGESLESRLSRLAWRVVPGGAKTQTMHPLDRDLFREDMVVRTGRFARGLHCFARARSPVDTQLAAATGCRS